MNTWLFGKILLTKFAKHRKLKMISGHPNHLYRTLTLYLCVYSLGRINDNSAPVKFSTVASGIWEWIIAEIFSTSQCDSFSMTIWYPAPERNHLKDHMKHFHTFLISFNSKPGSSWFKLPKPTKKTWNVTRYFVMTQRRLTPKTSKCCSKNQDIE